MTDREIEQALTVDPSPDLEGRIRRRIAAMPAPVSRRWAYMKLGMAFAAVGVVAVIVTLREEMPEVPQVEKMVQVEVPAPEEAAPIAEVAEAPRRPEPIRSEQESEPDIVDESPQDFYVSELQGLPIPVFELEVLPLPTFSIAGMAIPETMPLEPFRLTSPESGVEE